MRLNVIAAYVLDRQYLERRGEWTADHPLWSFTLTITKQEYLSQARWRPLDFGTSNL